MGPRLMSVFLILFITSHHVNARLEPSFVDRGNDVENSEGQTCSSCIEASMKAHEALSETDFFEDIEMLSAEACQMLPSELKIKCLEKTGAYIYQTRFLLHDLFHEIGLCKDAESCLDQPLALPSSQNAIISLPSDPLRKLQDDLETCVECRRAIKTIFDGVESTKSKKKILGSLVAYCSESGQNDPKQCKLSLNKYFPLLMAQIEELQPNDVCRMMSFCHGP